MNINKNIVIVAKTKTEQAAGALFAREWVARCGILPAMEPCASASQGESTGVNRVIFSLAEENEGEDYTLSLDAGGLVITAHRLRGLIYGVGRLLRNLTPGEDCLVLLPQALGTYAPQMGVRGHGIGYTDMSNSYEAWSESRLRRYVLDLAFFGLNTVETSYAPGSKPSPLMQYDFSEAFRILSQTCVDYDLELVGWYPLQKSKTTEETIAEMRKIYGNLPKLTALFIPGGDPGNLEPEAFLERCVQIKQAFAKDYPAIQLWPSAQAPHEYPDWGERFKKLMAKCPPEVDGIIYGPNHAMPLEELRRTIDLRYPLQHYPDLSHNVRCETPVHFQQDDWHFAWAATLSRESVNPRPQEYRLLHQKMRPYVQGQVSYSEGVHDDVNKAVWSALDFEYDIPVSQILREYVRLYFFGADAEKIAQGIGALEQNWQNDPAESACVEPTYALFCTLLRENPALEENWRFGLLLFRAACDKIVRDRRIFELQLLKEAETALRENRIQEGENILKREFPAPYRALRDSLLPMAERLFSQIGLQLDVARFGGMSWERGCTLETIDMPVTDRMYLLQKIQRGLSQGELLQILNRNRVTGEEYYFSFALHGFEVCGKQQGEYYMDFWGDRNPTGAIPMCMTKNYDHFRFETAVAGLTAGDYCLRVTYKNRNHGGISHHRVEVNGVPLFDGAGFGGTRDEAYEALFLPEGYQSIVYPISASLLRNGCADLRITEPTVGFVMPEFRFEKVNRG